MENTCIFCDREKIEERIIYEDENLYVIATLGQITDGGYVLLIPKRHVPCVGALREPEMRRLNLEGNRIYNALISEYKTPRVTTFEHGIVGQTVKHAHIHFIPASINFSDRIRKDFPQTKIERLRFVSDIRKSYSKNELPYLSWDDSLMGQVCWNPPAPSQYLRIVAAEELGRPERADWRGMDPELDRALWQETVIRLKPYFARSPF